MTRKFIIIADDYGDLAGRRPSGEAKTIEEAVEFASDWAGQHDHSVRIYQAVKLVKPERAPVTVSDL